jgi:PAS domain S-box-containing protein
MNDSVTEADATVSALTHEEWDGPAAQTSILLVDDQPAQLASCKAMLAALGVDCVGALSAGEALAQLIRQDFALVVLNASMCEMAGFDVARRIHSHPKGQRIPIILMTGQCTESDALKGCEPGMIDYISVPIVPQILRSKVGVFLELHRLRTESKQLNRALQDLSDQFSDHERTVAANAAELQAVFEHPTEITVVLEAVRDESGVIRDWIYRNANSNAAKNVGMTREEFIGRRQSEIMGAAAEAASAFCERVLSSGTPAHCESRFGDRDFLITAYRIGPDSMVSSSLDITDRKRMEREMREGKERFLELANNIDQFVWTCDELGLATWYNDRFYEYTGRPFEEMCGAGWLSVVEPSHVDRVQAEARRCLEAGEPWEDIFPVRRRDGEFRWFLSRAAPIRDAGGQVIRWFGTNTDVTEQLRLQEALQDADKRKDEWLAMLAHELRNPVAPIRTAAEVLLMLIKDDEKQRNLLGMIQRQSTQLARLLEDLLDVARITQGRIELRREVVSICACIEVAIETAEPLIREKRQRLTLTRPSQTCEVNADTARLTQCIANLLTNAARYTDAGGEIRVSATTEGSDAVVTVSDTGIGISAELLPVVFEPFVQSERTLDRSQGGLGIGLSICKRLVEMHGGSIHATSDGPGRGAEFTIRLPLAYSEPKQTVEPPPVDHSFVKRVDRFQCRALLQSLTLAQSLRSL